MAEQVTEESSDGEYLRYAKILASLLGQASPSFTTAIRALATDEVKHDGQIRPTSKYQVGRLLNIPSFKAMLYFATKDLREYQIENRKYLNIGLMMDCYRAGDLAALIACFSYYRKCRSLVGLDNWGWFHDRITKEGMIGAQLGTAIPKIGLCSGLLIGAIPFFGIVAMHLKDQTAFKKYRLELKKKNMRRDPDMERDIYGCTAGDVGVFLLSNAGLGTEIGSAFSRAFNPAASLANVSDELPYRMQIAHVWMEAIMSGKKQPECPIPGHYFPLSGDLIRFEQKMSEIQGGAVTFLSRTKDDLTPSSAPELFAKPSSSEEEVPAQLAQVFSEAEIEQMGKEDLDTLMEKSSSDNGDSKDELEKSLE